jgi:hypothetical protein
MPLGRQRALKTFLDFLTETAGWIIVANQRSDAGFLDAIQRRARTGCGTGAILALLAIGLSFGGRRSQRLRARRSIRVMIRVPPGRRELHHGLKLAAALPLAAYAAAIRIDSAISR